MKGHKWDSPSIGNWLKYLKRGPRIEEEEDVKIKSVLTQHLEARVSPTEPSPRDYDVFGRAIASYIKAGGSVEEIAQRCKPEMPQGVDQIEWETVRRRALDYLNSSTTSYGKNNDASQRAPGRTLATDLRNLLDDVLDELSGWTTGQSSLDEP